MSFDIAQDRKDLQKGVLVNYAAYPLKAAHPVLMVFLVRAYGAESYGLFIAGQAVLLMVTRLCVLGLDKAMLWWVPQQADGVRLAGAYAAARWSGGLAVASTIICQVAADPVAQLAEAPEAATTIRVMSCALLPTVIMELVLGITMGTRRMGTNVLVRETIQPMVLVLVGLLFWPLGWGEVGLAAAMVVASVLSCAVALWSAKKVFKDDQDPMRRGKLPARIWTYAWPMWLSEVNNTFLQRLDMWAIAALSDLRTLGIYAVVTQFGNTIRSIRRGYDPIVLAITSRIGAERDLNRLAAGYSYGTAMVVGTQLPVLAFFILFAGDLLPLYGEGFEEGAMAVAILGSFWVVTSAMSLAGIVVNAYGYSRLSLYNVMGTTVVQAALLWALVPKWGLNGAAVAVGVAYLVLSLVQVIQMRFVTGGYHLRADTARAVGIGLLTGGGLALARVLIPGAESLCGRGAIFALSAAVYLWMFLPVARQGGEKPNPVDA